VALQDKFCLTFFPIHRIVSLRCEILSFQQREKESLGAALARFTNLISSGQNLAIREPRSSSISAKVSTKILQLSLVRPLGAHSCVRP
jgi:hypothetical protein